MKDKGVLDKNVHDGHRDRVRQKIAENGLAPLSDHEVLEYMLFGLIPRKDVNGLAHALIDHFNGFARVLDASFDELKSFPGLPENAALALSTQPLIYSRYLASKLEDVKTINTKSDIVDLCVSRIGSYPVEHLLIILLDNRRRILRVIDRTEGMPSKVNGDFKVILNAALKASASYVIIAHNHPSSDLSPSMDDLAVTKALVEKCITFDVPLLDSLVVNSFAGVSLIDFAESKYKAMQALYGTKQAGDNFFEHVQRLEMGECQTRMYEYRDNLMSESINYQVLYTKIIKNSVDLKAPLTRDKLVKETVEIKQPSTPNNKKNNKDNNTTFMGKKEYKISDDGDDSNLF